MSTRRAVRALSMVLVCALAGCSAAAPSPPTYRLHGDACGVVPLDTFQALTGGPPTSPTSGDLTQGLGGGTCAVEFDGADGYAKVSVFMAIHTRDEAAASAMYATFRHDSSTTAEGTTVTDVPDLGHAAYLQRQNLTGRDPWEPTDPTLYKFGVQDGGLVLTLIFSGYARPDGGAWPAREQDLEDRLGSVVRQIMARLAG